MKLDRGQSPNILSEIIILGENGGCGGNIPISHFLKSLAHSALVISDDRPEGTLDQGHRYRYSYIYIAQKENNVLKNIFD